MRHDWIFDVLRDLRDYAERNHLPALAEQAEIALRIAQSEIAAVGDRGEDPEPPHRDRRH